jgi:hypothetical protein
VPRFVSKKAINYFKKERKYGAFLCFPDLDAFVGAL